MEPGREVNSPETHDSTPLPIQVDTLGDAVPAVPPHAPQPPSPPQPLRGGPTPETLLLAVATAEGSWFPSRYAAEKGIPRDSLDEPLAELRLAELVRVSDWVRGVGQGYILTPEGEVAAANPAARERLNRGPRAESASLTPPFQPEPDAALADDATVDTASEQTPSDSELTLKPPLVVPGLLMANALWFFVLAVVSIRWGLTPSRSLSEGHPDVLRRFGAVSGADLLNGEWWRLLTACFVHIGALHLIGNLFALAMMGPLAELLWGRVRLLVIYLVSGLVGSALAMALRPDTILAGASGAIWGIQMSLFAWLFTFRRHLPPDLASDWFRRLCVVFILNAGISFLPGVSWEGHLGGGVAGFLVAGLLTAARFGDSRRKFSAWLLIALLPVMAIAGLAVAMDAKGMTRWQQLRQRLDSERDARKAMALTQKIRSAETEYNTHVAPRLLRLTPRAVEQPEAEARELIKMSNRPPEQVKAVRAKLESLKTTANEIVQYTTRPAVEVEAVDRTRERAWAFAAARRKSFDILLGFLASPEPPTPNAWETWHSADADADRLWVELVAK